MAGNVDERALIRDLAQQVAVLAADRENEEIKQRWKDVNGLRRPDRPPVWCRPVGAWDELLPKDTLSCRDPVLRNLEYQFRQQLLKRDIGDDTPLEQYFPVKAVFDVEPANTWGLAVDRIQPDTSGGSWAYKPPLKTIEDLEDLRIPCFTYNEAKTTAALEQADALLGDILPPRVVCPPPLSATLGTPAASLRGLTEMLMDTLLQPELLHRLMGHLRDSVLQAMDQVEQTGLLTPNNTGPMTTSDPLEPKGDSSRRTYRHCWVMANSQEFDAVSPAMWEEFCLQYQKPIFERFGYVGYGCCEDLTQKMERVLEIPNLRIFVCSAWTDLNRVVDQVGTKHVIMWRQKATDVVFPDSVEDIEQDLTDGLKQLQGCHVQIVLRELQTLAKHPDRLHVWTQLAKELGARYV